jgi:senataxin
MLGYGKHLLNVQYRMHPKISKFPVGTFYNGKISDGPNVTTKSYEKTYLASKVFGSYSFINVEGGHETTEKHGRSLKNTIEAAAVSRIVQRLFKGNHHCCLCRCSTLLFLITSIKKHSR